MLAEPSQIDLICSDIDLCQVSQLPGNWETLAMLSSDLQIKEKRVVLRCGQRIEELSQFK